MARELPEEVLAVFREFRVCEFTTLGRDGSPISAPLAAHFREEPMRFTLTTTIGFPAKAFNIRRNPRVSLLFSEPTASGLSLPPAVLVQGDATAPDEVVTSTAGMEGYWRDTIYRRQPASEMISGNAVMRKLMDWYYMRLIITVTPRTITWWPAADFSKEPQSVEVAHVV